MDPTNGEENQNNIERAEGDGVSQEKLQENGESSNSNPNPNTQPNQNPKPNPSPNENEKDASSTSNPGPAKKPHYFDLNLVYIELDDNDTKSEVVEPAAAAATLNEHPPQVKLEENEFPEREEPNWDEGVSEPKDVINVSDSDSELTQSSDNRKETLILFETCPDKSPVCDWSGITPFMPSEHDTAKSSSSAAKRRKFTDGFVKVKQEKED